MLDKPDPYILADFFLDSAKIIFASLVVGVFVPQAVGSVPWLTLAMGLSMTVLFLGIAMILSEEKTHQL